MDFGVAVSRYRAGTGALEDDEVRCSGVPRANTASLSGHGSAKQASRNCTYRYPIAAPKQRCGPAPNGMKARVVRAATMSLSQNRIRLSGVDLLSGFRRS